MKVQIPVVKHDDGPKEIKVPPPKRGSVKTNIHEADTDIERTQTIRQASDTSMISP